MTDSRYEPRFDWDLAARLYWEGVKVREIADRLGVSHQAVRRVVVPGEAEKRGQDKFVWDHTMLVCPCCGGPMSRNSVRSGSKHCRACQTKKMVTSVRPDSLRCSGCGLWKPDSEFYADRTKHQRRRRGHLCKLCGNARRKAQRRRVRADVV